ncbi:MAG: glucose 1-dehydrogenase [Thermoflexales bacterium]|nr:glucose 1-dehydrogenase [Thermoflexales bacterium]
MSPAAPTNLTLGGRVALITGASRGIGAAIAAAYATAGAKVALVSRRLEGCQPLADELTAAGHAAIALACHTGERSQISAAVREVEARLGGIDIVVNNAATNPHFGSLLSATEAQWDKTLQVNVKGYFGVIQEAAQGMLARGHGKIINIASIAGLTPGRGMGVYSVSKAAVIALTQALAQELGPQGVQVNAIAPGVIRTRFSAALWQNEALTDAVSAKAGRIGEPDDLVGVALLLASDASNYINGAVFTVDGGLEAFGTL